MSDREKLLELAEEFDAWAKNTTCIRRQIQRSDFIDVPKIEQLSGRRYAFKKCAAALRARAEIKP